MTARLVIRQAGIKEVGKRLSDRLAEWGRQLEAMARANAPRDTGYLASRMFVLVYLDGAIVYGDGPTPPDLRGKGVEVFVGNDAGYGRFVHDGTNDTPPHPFLAVAFAAMKPRLRA